MPGMPTTVPGWRIGIRWRIALEAVLGTNTTEHWMEVLGGAGLAVGRLLDLPSVFEDPQVIHNQMLVEMSHQAAGTIKVTGSPVRLDGEPARAIGPAAGARAGQPSHPAGSRSQREPDGPAGHRWGGGSGGPE